MPALRLWKDFRGRFIRRNKLDLVPQLILNSIIAGAIYTIIVLGFNLVYSVTKFFNVAHGAYTVVGAYTVLWLYKMLKLDIFLSITAGILVAGVMGFIFDKMIFLPLRNRNGSKVVMFVASLGLFTVIQSIVAMIFSNDFIIMTDTFVADRSFAILGGVITDIQVIIIICEIIIISLLALLMNKTKFGKAVKAISDDEEVARINGINTNGIIALVFFIGSAIAGLSGTLIGFNIGLMPTMGMELLLKGVIAAIVGGVGNMFGGVLGAFMLGFVENFGTWEIAGQWKDTIAFCMLIVFLLFRPQGIMNK